MGFSQIVVALRHIAETVTRRTLKVQGASRLLKDAWRRGAVAINRRNGAAVNQDESESGRADLLGDQSAIVNLGFQGAYCVV